MGSSKGPSSAPAAAPRLSSYFAVFFAALACGSDKQLAQNGPACAEMPSCTAGGATTAPNPPCALPPGAWEPEPAIWGPPPPRPRRQTWCSPPGSRTQRRGSLASRYRHPNLPKSHPLSVRLGVRPRNCMPNRRRTSPHSSQAPLLDQRADLSPGLSKKSAERGVQGSNLARSGIDCQERDLAGRGWRVGPAWARDPRYCSSAPLARRAGPTNRSRIAAQNGEVANLPLPSCIPATLFLIWAAISGLEALRAATIGNDHCGAG